MHQGTPSQTCGPQSRLTFDKFHVDNLSSAHVYVRMRDGETWDAMPKELLEDCAQLTKANSIEGAITSLQSLCYTN